MDDDVYALLQERTRASARAHFMLHVFRAVAICAVALAVLLP